VSNEQPSGKGGSLPLPWVLTVAFICFGVGLPLYLVKQDQNAKERARLELEAKCSAYEEELTAIIKRAYRLSAKGISLEEQAKSGSIQFSAIMPGLEDNIISIQESTDKMKSVNTLFVSECGKERSQAWFRANFEKLRLEVEAQ